MEGMTDQLYLQNVSSIDVAIQFGGEFDWNPNVEHLFLTTIKEQLGSYLATKLGSILQTFEVYTSFRLTHDPASKTTVFAVVLVELIMGSPSLDDLIEYDKETVTSLLESFFQGATADALIDALSELGINLDYILLGGGFDFTSVTKPVTTAPQGSGGGDGDGGGGIQRTAILAGVLSGSLVFAILAAALIRNNIKQSHRFDLEHEMAGDAPTDKDHETLLVSPDTHDSDDASQSSVSSIEFSVLSAMTPTLEEIEVAGYLSRVGLAKKPSEDAPGQKIGKPPSSDTSSIFTTDPPGVADQKSLNQRWHPWRRQSKRKVGTIVDVQELQQGEYETIYIDGKLQRVYLSPVSL
jgi:hypothetical protein